MNLELPFMATEVILMQCVKAGGDRQILHESIREHSMAAGRRVQHCIPSSPPFYFILHSFLLSFLLFFPFLSSIFLLLLLPFVLLFVPPFSFLLSFLPLLYYLFLVSINSNSANIMSSSVSHYHTFSYVFALYVFVCMLGEGGRCRQ